MSLSNRVSFSGARQGALQDDLDDFVRAFEAAYYDQEDGADGVDPADYLPPHDHPLHLPVLRELVRVDLEFSWERGRPRPLDDYRTAFPALAADADGLREIAYEEYRLRRRAGQDPPAEEYRLRYGLAIDPSSRRPVTVRSAVASILDGSAREWGGPDDIEELPGVGDDFLNFRLIGELGRGAFGRVYLARQADMADRPVVLKVTADAHDEAQTLAQLQHDHIVPVYSGHRRGPLRAVCMPYLGSVTLRDVLEDLKALGTLPSSGRGLLSSLAKSSVRKGACASTVEAGADAAGASEILSEAPASTPSAAKPAPAGSPAGRALSALRGRLSRGRRRPGGASALDPAGRARPGAAESSSLRPDARVLLGGLSYAEAVVWLASRLANGLGHAHERGILHRDLKPANVLLTDDGRPMLLDFNLADDGRQRDEAGRASRSGIGGTLPYMAPEHLEAFLGLRREVDARSDLYAMGVILFELLTGRPPFPQREGSRAETVRAMVADRQGAPPRLRVWNRAVSPAVESIVRRCLEPDPARRYSSAAELCEDLERQLAHRPLRHAPEPSRVERAGKWGRRNRWLVLGLALLAGGTGVSAAVAVRESRLASLDARGVAARFDLESDAAQYLLRTRVDEVAKRREGISRANEALRALGPVDDPRWAGKAPAVHLPPDDRVGLRSRAGVLLTLVSRAEARLGDALENPKARREAWSTALRTAARAEACFPADSAPRGLLEHETGLAERLGDAGAAREFAVRAAAAPVRSARDLTDFGVALADRGKVAEAITALKAATDGDARDLWAWYALGNAQMQAGHFADARGSFNVCVSLRPELGNGRYLRGWCLLYQRQFADAVVEFDHAIALDANDPNFYYHRAVARAELKQTASALEDLNRAVAIAPDEGSYYLARARARAETGDKEGARSDVETGLRITPTLEYGWVARALVFAGRGQADAALADLGRALKLNARSYAALSNIAYVESGVRHDDAKAAVALDRLLEFYPGDAVSQASRAVVNARLGRRAAALADAEAVRNSPACSPFLLYQIAGAYALTSVGEPADRQEALRLLALAFKQGMSRDPALKDHDLDPIRDDPAFRTLLGIP